jgi:IS5 family transposase
MMFKILVIQAANTLSDERTEFLINDRLSFMRFLGLGLSDRVPDARTIWLFREKLTRAGAIKGLFERFDAALRAAGFIAMAGQIVDASLVAAPKQRNTDDEKRQIKEGRIPQKLKARPGKLRQKDRDARWTIKFSKAKERPDGTRPPVDIAIPTFGYQKHVGIDRGFGLIRTWMVTDAAAYEGARLREGLLDKTNTAAVVWADSAYRSAANEDFLARNGFVSRIHRKKPPGQAHAGENPPGQCREVQGALPHRARLRRAEIPDGVVRAHDWDRAGDDEDRHGQPRLQPQASALPAEASPGMTAEDGTRRTRTSPSPLKRSPRFPARPSLPSVPARAGADRTVQLPRRPLPRPALLRSLAEYEAHVGGGF